MTQPVVIIDGLSDFWTDIQDAATTTFGHIHRLEGYTNNMRIITPTIERIDRTEPILNALRQSDAHAADLYDDAGVYLRTVRIDMDDETRCANGECNCTTMEKHLQDEARYRRRVESITADNARANAEHLIRLDADLDNNRQVHAFDRYVEVVRYDRQGKWYLETRTDPVVRTKLNLAAAVDYALACQLNCGIIRPDLHGGSTFDRKIRQALNV